MQAGLRNKPNYIPTQYSVDMAVLVTTYMRKQIAEIALPSAPRPGLNIKQTFKGVLADAESRERWLSRFSYWCVFQVYYVNNCFSTGVVSSS
jgi:mediator of RNA polymerase II transcription subunit 12